MRRIGMISIAAVVFAAVASGMQPASNAELQGVRGATLTENMDSRLTNLCANNQQATDCDAPGSSCGRIVWGPSNNDICTSNSADPGDTCTTGSDGWCIKFANGTCDFGVGGCDCEVGEPYVWGSRTYCVTDQHDDCP
jgi:hypothetical protein